MTDANEKTDRMQADAGAAVVRPHSPVGSLATLLAAHLLRDGETVLLILKPSLWFIVLSCANFCGVAITLACVAALADHRIHDRVWFEFAGMAIAVRVVWALLQWMGRLYVLTDQRILRIYGVFTVDVFDCPLRKVVRTRMVTSTREKVVAVGSIEIIPADQAMPAATWRMINRPVEIHDRLIAAINRAKQNGCGTGKED